jgi:hypothetical protein
MCRAASGIAVKDRILVSQHDAHEVIVGEYHLDDRNGAPDFVRFEIAPPAGGDFTAPLKKWVFHVDQDLLPRWWSAKRYEALVREWLAKSWFPSRVNGGILILHSGFADLYGTSHANLYDNSHADLYGTSRADLYDNSSVNPHDKSRADLYDNSRANLHDNSSVNLHDKSRADLYGTSRANLYGESRADLYDNSRANLHDKSRADLYDNSRANLHDKSFARIYSSKATISSIRGMAVAIDCTGEKPIYTVRT